MIECTWTAKRPGSEEEVNVEDNSQPQTPQTEAPQQTGAPQAEGQQVPTLVTIGVIVDIMGDALAHDNGPRWHRLVLSAEMAGALYAQLAPMFPK